MRIIPTRGKGVCHHMHHSTHTHRERAALVRTHARHATGSPPWLIIQGGMCNAWRAERSAAQRSAAQRSAAQRSAAQRALRDTCTTETQCTHLHVCRAQSCHFVSLPPSTDILPFLGVWRTESLCADSVHSSGVWPSPRSAMGLGCASSPRAEKECVTICTSAHTHTESALHSCAHHARHGHVPRNSTRGLLAHCPRRRWNE